MTTPLPTTPSPRLAVGSAPTAPRRHRGLTFVAGLTAVAALAAGCSDDKGTPAMSIGTEAIADYASPAYGTVPAVDSTVAVTVVAVRTGTTDELTAAGLQLDDEEADATPYYVDLRFTNKGDGDLPRNLGVLLENGDDESLTSVTIIGESDLTACVEADEGTLQPGETYETCEFFLVPEGWDVTKVRFVSQAPDATITFLDWAVEASDY